MNKVFALFVALFALSLAIQAPDNKGTEFYLAFTNNPLGSYTLEIHISSELSVQAQVTVPGIGYATTVNVPQDGTVTVTVPTNAILNVQGVQNKGIYVRSLDPTKELTVIGFNRATATTDAFLAEPVDVLGTEYLGAGVATGYGSGGNMGIVATQDGTTVTVTVPSGSPFGGVSSSQTWTLNRLQALYLAGGDPTGVKVSSSKPVAVFSGHECANPDGTDYCCCDYIVEQLPPTSSYANEFLLAPLATRANSMVRVTGNSANNVLNVNGANVATIQAQRFYQFIAPGAAKITSSQPSLVFQISRSSFIDNTVSDPFYMWVPPYAQNSANYFFYTLPNFNNWLNLVIESGKQGGLLLDGAAFSATWTPVPGTSFVYTQKQVSAGAHKIYHNSPIVPFAIFAYGWADYDSYGYPGGNRLAPLQDPCTVTAPVAGDGIDNDCDQRIDEELNNGIDDDGDGRIDEDLAAPPPRTCCEQSTVVPSISGNIVDLTIQCGQSVPAAPAVTGHIDCPEPTTITLTPQVTTTPGSCSGRSTIRRTWQIVDDCGRSATRVQTITIVDTAAPVLTTPSNRVVECGQSTLPFNTGLASATDSCSGAVSNVPYSDYTVAGQCAGTSTITRTWSATDACGNTASNQQTITVVDTTSPITSAQNACVFPPNGLYKCFDVAHPTYVSASDTCSSATLSFNNDCRNVNTGDATGCDYNAATQQLCVRALTDHESDTSYTFSFTARDGCGNSANQQVTVSVPNALQNGQTCSAADVCLNDCPENTCTGVRKDLLTEDGHVVGFATIKNKLNWEVSVEIVTYEGNIPDRGWWMKGFVFTVGSKRTVRDFPFGNEQSRWFEVISFTDAFPGQTIRCGDDIDVLLVVSVTNDKRNNNAPASLAYLTLAGSSKKSFQLPPGAETRTTELNLCCECTIRTQTQNDWGNLCTLNNGRTTDSARIREVVCRRDEFWEFASSWCFADGITIGCSAGFTAAWTNPNALATYLADEATAAVLSQNWVNPPNRALGSLAGETAGLALNIKLDECDADWSTSCTTLRSLHVCRHPNDSGRTQCQPFWGQTVGQIFAEANAVLGGCDEGNVSELFECVRYINRAFVDGKRLWEAPDFVANGQCPQ